MTATATVTATLSNPTPTPLPAVDLALVKRANRAVVEAGGLITYTLTYSNVGLMMAEQVVITETVPLHTALVITQSTPGWHCPQGTGAGARCTFAIVQVAPQQQGTIRYVVQVVSDLPTAAQIQNTAAIGNFQGELATTIGNNVDALTVRVAPPTALDGAPEPKPASHLLFLPLIIQE